MEDFEKEVWDYVDSPTTLKIIRGSMKSCSVKFGHDDIGWVVKQKLFFKFLNNPALFEKVKNAVNEKGNNPFLYTISLNLVKDYIKANQYLMYETPSYNPVQEVAVC